MNLKSCKKTIEATLEEVLQQLRDSGTVEIKRYQLISKNAEEIQRVYALIRDLKLSNSDLVDKLKTEITEFVLEKLKQIEADGAIKQKSIEERFVKLEKETGKVPELTTRCDKLEAENEALKMKMSNMVEKEDMDKIMGEMLRKSQEESAKKERQLEDDFRQQQQHLKDEIKLLRHEMEKMKATTERNGCIQVNPQITIQPMNNNQWPLLQNPWPAQVTGQSMIGNGRVGIAAGPQTGVALRQHTGGPSSTETGYASLQVSSSGSTSEHIGTRQQNTSGKSNKEEIYI